MRCVDCKYHKAFPTTNIHWCEATKKHRRISDEDAYVDAPCKVADRKTESQTEPQTECETCKHNRLEWFSEKCDECSKAHSNYEPQTERSE